MHRVAVVNGIRTPFCKMGTAFNGMSAQSLGAVAVRELLARAELDPAVIDEVVFGNVAQPPEATNISRVIALLSGVPHTTPAFTVQRNCASGIESAVTAALKIKSGEADCIVAGGTESMSNIPVFMGKRFQEMLYQLAKAKTLKEKAAVVLRVRLKDLRPHIGLQMGLTDSVCGLNMGQTAEVLAKEFGITRKQQDEFALASHQKACRAREVLREEIVPVIPEPGFKEAVLDDNGPRDNQTIEALQKLRPFFDRRSGTVTAGNSSQVTDGAAALLLMSEARAKKLGYQPLGYIRAYAFAGVEPHRMGIGPAHAIPQVLKKAGMKLDDIGAIEINEAFAAQVLACIYALDSTGFAKKFDYEGYTGHIYPKSLNVNGGAIALGHPVGATGARLILTMLKHMNRSNLETGLVSLCIGGGQGAAVILER